MSWILIQFLLEDHRHDEFLFHHQYPCIPMQPEPKDAESQKQFSHFPQLNKQFGAYVQKMVEERGSLYSSIY
jgi:hypothetical protein